MGGWSAHRSGETEATGGVTRGQRGRAVQGARTQCIFAAWAEQLTPSTPCFTVDISHGILLSINRKWTFCSGCVMVPSVRAAKIMIQAERPLAIITGSML